MSHSVRDSSSPTAPRTVISSDGAAAVLRAVEAKAAAIGVPVVIAVVDDSTALKAFLRMDGTPPGAIRWAIDKAVTAAAFRAPTHVLDHAMQDVASASALASFMAQPHATLAPGGFPLVIDGAVVGAVGASGGSPEQDQMMAESGLAAL